MEFNMHYNFSNPELDENILESTEMSPTTSNYVFSPTADSIKSEGWNTNNNHNYLFNHQQSWQWSSLDHESGQQTPMQNMHYQENHPQQAFFSNPHYTPAQTIHDSMPGSPENHSTPTENRELRQSHSRASPALASQAPFMRGDGMKKKNSKKQIPADLKTIEELISQATDEQDEAKIKELKANKRLLRNREAALNSRQRRKQDHDRLRQENQALRAQMEARDEDRAQYQREIDQLLRANKQLTTELQRSEFQREQLDQVNIRLLEENQNCKEMIQEATNREGQQNKMIRELTDDLSRREAVESSATFDEESYVDMGAIEGFPSDPVIKQDVDAVEPAKPAAQGLLLMLLLFGAFVASKGGNSSSIPPVSDDMVAASRFILDDVFSEAGVSNTMSSFNPAASAPLTWNGLSNAHVNMAQITRNGFQQLALDDFDQLTQPSLEQQREQLFGMSVEQFNDVNHYDFLNDAPPVMASSSGRRNLAESLAAMRAGKGKKTDVYTRSLLWDQVPQDVVRRFAQMVEGYDSGVNPDMLG